MKTVNFVLPDGSIVEAEVLKDPSPRASDPERKCLDLNVTIDDVKHWKEAVPHSDKHESYTWHEAHALPQDTPST